MKKIGWFDVKTKFKHVIRSTFYSGFFQWLSCQLITNYLRLVFYSSKKTFVNYDSINQFIAKGQPVIIVAWHNRIALSGFTFLPTKKFNKDYKFSVLASAHGDGKIIGNVMNNLGIGLILGSTRKNASKKGIDIANFRKIFKVLKTPNNALCLTPDGPRGPRFKVSGEVASIAKSVVAPIFPVAYSISNRKVFNSWDKFILPLPFSKIAFVLGAPIYVDQNADKDNLEKVNQDIENGINFICRKADELVGRVPMN